MRETFNTVKYAFNPAADGAYGYLQGLNNKAAQALSAEPMSDCLLKSAFDAMAGLHEGFAFNNVQFSAHIRVSQPRTREEKADALRGQFRPVLTKQIASIVYTNDKRFPSTEIMQETTAQQAASCAAMQGPSKA